MTSFERRFLSVGLNGAAQAHEGGDGRNENSLRQAY